MKNKFVVITGPSGVGKTTINKKLFASKGLDLAYSCSVTTRKPRKKEQNGKDYYFVTQAKFKSLVANHKFIEWNEHFSNKYGTLKSEIHKIIKNGKTPLLEVDVEGAQKIIQEYGNSSVISIFIVPPSIAELKKRLESRRTESKSQLKKRIARVEKELAAIKYFKYVVVNRTPAQAVRQILRILKGEDHCELCD